MPDSTASRLRTFQSVSRGVGQLGQGRRVRDAKSAGSNPAAPTTYSREQIWALAITLLLYMADMHVVNVLEVKERLGLRHAAAFGLIHGLEKRGWAAHCHGGWQLTATGWLLASAEESDELDLTFTAAE